MSFLFLAAFLFVCFIREYLECKSVVDFSYHQTVCANFDENATWSSRDEDEWRNHLQDAFYNNLMNLSVQLRKAILDLSKK